MTLRYISKGADMMKRLLLCLTLLMLAIPMAQADFPDRVREDMP